jgi:hypothetical protein
MAVSGKGGHFPQDIILMGVRWDLDQRPMRIGPKTHCATSLAVVSLYRNMDKTVWGMGGALLHGHALV